MNYSRQREVILEEVRRKPVHPTAETVFQNLRATHPKLSLGTVYRNLNLLSELGEIRKIPVPNAKDRFDGTLAEHSHILCTECGAVEDVFLDSLAALDTEICQKTTYQLTGKELLLYGVCPNCRQKKEEHYGTERK